MQLGAAAALRNRLAAKLMQLEAAAAAVHEELAAMLMQLGAKVVFGIHPMACTPGQILHP